MARVQRTSRRQRVLHFDVENRPLAYWFDGQTTGELTAIAWGWADEHHVESEILEPNGAVSDLLLRFLPVLEGADIVTGHYARKHDLPLLNAACLEEGFPPLEPLLVSDTKLDLIRLKDLSASQESLAAMFGLQHPKHHMTQNQWRNANRLWNTDETRKRVEADVRQHRELRCELLDRDALKPPRMWRP